MSMVCHTSTRIHLSRSENKIQELLIKVQFKKRVETKETILIFKADNKESDKEGQNNVYLIYISKKRLRMVRNIV